MIYLGGQWRPLASFVLCSPIVQTQSTLFVRITVMSRLDLGDQSSEMTHRFNSQPSLADTQYRPQLLLLHTPPKLNAQTSATLHCSSSSKHHHPGSHDSGLCEHSYELHFRD